MTSFFKSLIISGLDAPPNRTKHPNMSSVLIFCNSKQICEVKVIYTPFLRSKMKIVWKNMHDIRVSQFDSSLWTSPRARYLHKLNSFGFYGKRGSWWTKYMFKVFRVLSWFWQEGHFCEYSSKISVQKWTKIVQNDEFFQIANNFGPNATSNQNKTSCHV